MLRKISVVIPTCAALALLSSAAYAVLPAAGVEVTVEATYQNDAAGPNTAAAGDPGSVDLTATAGPGGFGIGDQGVAGQTALTTFDEANGRARASLPGTVGSYSHAGGFNPGFMPGPTSDVTASAEARAVTHWQVVSTDPAITSVGVNVAAFYDGSLLTSDFANVPAGAMSASVLAGLNAVDANGNTFYSFEADATVQNGIGLTASANWVGDFIVGSNGSNDQATVDYFEVFSDAFFVNVGDVFAWESILYTSAAVPGPFELFAIADFFNTGEGTLSVDTPGVTLVQVSAVPLPAALPLMMLALAGIARLGRRHHT